MRRALFVAAILLGGAFIVIGGARGLSYSPPSRADLPPRPSIDAEALAAAVEGCVKSDGRWTQGTEDGVLYGRCVPSLGVYPVRKP